MNNQNDISKRHSNKQVTNQNDIFQKSLYLDAFFKNPLEKSLYIAAKKIEKIVGAIYLITDVMGNDLPLTTSLRSESIDLLANAFDVIAHDQTPTAREMLEVSLRLDHVASLVRIGLLAHHISPMNADIVLSELDSVSKVYYQLINDRNKEESHFVFSRVDINQPMITQSFMQDPLFEGIINHYDSKRHQNDIKTTLSNQNDTIKDKEEIKTTIQKDIIKIDRKQDILKILRSKQVGTLTDIKGWIPDVSDKTLQRELAELIAMNLVKKEGNKRWTTYRII